MTRRTPNRREIHAEKRRSARDGSGTPERFRQELIAARVWAGLTQGEVAARIGTTQSAIARLEGGTVTPTVETLCRLGEVLELCFEVTPRVGLTAHPLPLRGLTIDDLQARRDEILRIADTHGVANVRVFGSIARGEADAKSDVDLLVDMVTEADGFAYLKILEDLQGAFGALLRRKVDVVATRSLGNLRERVLRDAVPI